MNIVDCEWESEVLAAFQQNRWPGHVDASLRAHVAACAICADVLAIAGAMEGAHEEMRAQAVVPDSGRVWWLAQMRARREATEAAGRPITAAQVIAFACAIGLLGACFGATSAWFQAALHSTVSSLSTFKFRALVLVAVAFVTDHGAVLLGMAAILLVVPAAYLTMLRE